MQQTIPLSRYVESRSGRGPVSVEGSSDDLLAIVTAIADASIAIADLVALGTFVSPRSGKTSRLIEIDLDGGPARQAETLIIDKLRGLGIKEIVSAGRDERVLLSEDGRYTVAIDALDGAVNIDTNMALGTIFSVSFAGDQSTPSAGTMQLAAGFVVYGPQTNLVLTLGDGVDIFKLDRGASEYRLAEEKVRVPEMTADYAIDASNYNHWPSAVRSLIDDHLDDAGEPGERTFNMRWLGSLVAEAYRILVRGGVFLCPPDKRHTCETGCQRLLTAAHPIAFVMEQANAKATTGYESILERATNLPSERTSFIFGSREAVKRIERLMALPETYSETAPLFRKYGLFRD